MIKVSYKNGDSHRDDPTSTLPVSTDDIEKLLEFQIESKQVPSTRKRLWEGRDSGREATTKVIKNNEFHRDPVWGVVSHRIDKLAQS